MKLEFSGQIFEKHSNIKLHENPSGGRRVFPYERKDGRREGHKEVIVAFRDFRNMPKN